MIRIKRESWQAAAGEASAVALPIPSLPLVSRRRRPARQLNRTLLVSLLLHGIVAAFLLLAVREHQLPQERLPADFAVVFEGGSKAGPSAPKPGQENDFERPPPGPPAPHPPQEPPAAPSPAPPVPAVPVPEMPAPAGPPQPPAPPSAAPPRTMPVPPAPATPLAEPPVPALQVPKAAPPVAAPAPPSPAPLVPRPAAPITQPALPALRPSPPAVRPARPAPRRLPHSPPRAASGKSAFPQPMNFSFGRVRKGALDRSPFAGIQNNKALGGDWFSELQAWVEARKFYPPEAAAAGQEGPTTVRLTIDRDGDVESVQIAQSSGSQWLDMAWVSMWRGAHVPPFPPGTREDRETFEFTMDYHLIRR